MANKFVWSGAGGSNDGSSWDNAYTSLMRDWGAEGTFTPATDYIYVRSVHSETQSASTSITGSTVEGTTAPCRVVCVVGDTTGTTPGALATGAAVNTDTAAEIRVNEGLYVYGVDFLADSNIRLHDTATDHETVLESCRLEITATGTTLFIYLGGFTASRADVIRLVNVIVDFANASQGLFIRAGNLQWKGGSVAFDVSVLVKEPATSNYRNKIEFLGLDLSALSSSQLIDGGAAVDNERLVIFSRCLLATGATIVTGTIDVPGFRVESYHCQIGTDADPAYQMEIQDSRGKITADTARYRTGGASDGVRTNPISWDFDTTAGSVRGYPGHALEGPPISAWTDGDATTAHTYRIAVASDATINDDEMWIEVEGPNDAATNSLAVFNTTRVAPETAAAALTTDSGSTWTGSGVGTKQYMQVSYTPDKPGPLTVRVFMAKASDNVYVDPKIQIDP